MPYVLVTADFPDVTSSQRDEIYKCLKAKQWIKYTNIGRDISTVWHASFKSEVSCVSAIQASINEFVECSRPYTIPKLVLHCGANEPTVHNL